MARSEFYTSATEGPSAKYATQPVLKDVEQREVGSALQELEKTTEVLYIATNKLYNRLESVIRQEPEGEDKRGCLGYRCCKLAQDIDRVILKISQITDVLSSLERRVQL